MHYEGDKKGNCHNHLRNVFNFDFPMQSKYHMQQKMIDVNVYRKYLSSNTSLSTNSFNSIS